MIALWITAACLAAEPVIERSETVRSGRLADRLTDKDDADLVLLYSSEQAGVLGPCGCDEVPKGGMARLASYVDAVREQDGERVLVLHAGGWASDQADLGTLVTDAGDRNAAMDEALQAIGFDAVNGSYRDLPWAWNHASSPVVASNLRPPGVTAPDVQRLRVGQLDVAILGVTRRMRRYLLPEDTHHTPAVRAVNDLLPDLDADLVIVLAYETGEHTDDLARIPGVDVVIEAGDHAGKEAPWVYEAVWTRSRAQGLHVGEMRLWLTDTGEVERVVDRWVNLDANIPEDRSVRRIERDLDRLRRRRLRHPDEPAKGR